MFWSSLFTFRSSQPGAVNDYNRLGGRNQLLSKVSALVRALFPFPFAPDRAAFLSAFNGLDSV